MPNHATPAAPKMQLLVVRHAIAEDQREFARTGRPDEMRPLTAVGAKRMRRATPALRRLVPTLGVVASSPLLRARQTASILAHAYPEADTRILDELAPDARLPALLGWLREHAAHRSVAVVGHEPHLSHLISWLLSGRFVSFVQMRKGAACLLSFAAEPTPGDAEMHWLMQPRQLRQLFR